MKHVVLITLVALGMPSLYAAEKKAPPEPPRVVHVLDANTMDIMYEGTRMRCRLKDADMSSLNPKLREHARRMTLAYLVNNHGAIKFASNEFDTMTKKIKSWRQIVVPKLSFEDTPIDIVLGHMEELAKKHGKGVAPKVKFSTKDLTRPAAVPPLPKVPVDPGFGNDRGNVGDDDDDFGDDDDEFGDDDDDDKKEWQPIRITMDFDNVPWLIAMRYICEQAQLDHCIYADGVEVTLSGKRTFDKFPILCNVELSSKNGTTLSQELLRSGLAKAGKNAAAAAREAEAAAKILKIGVWGDTLLKIPRLSRTGLINPKRKILHAVDLTRLEIQVGEEKSIVNVASVKPCIRGSAEQMKKLENLLADSLIEMSSTAPLEKCIALKKLRIPEFKVFRQSPVSCLKLLQKVSGQKITPVFWEDDEDAPRVKRVATMHLRDALFMDVLGEICRQTKCHYQIGSDEVVVMDQYTEPDSEDDPSANLYLISEGCSLSYWLIRNGLARKHSSMSSPDLSWAEEMARKERKGIWGMKQAEREGE